VIRCSRQERHGVLVAVHVSCGSVWRGRGGGAQRAGWRSCISRSRHIGRSIGKVENRKRNGTAGLQDYRTTGLQDDGTTGPQDDGTTGLQDDGTTGRRDYRTTGLQDDGTTGLQDDGTTGRRDKAESLEESESASSGQNLVVRIRLIVCMKAVRVCSTLRAVCEAAGVRPGPARGVCDVSDGRTLRRGARSSMGKGWQGVRRKWLLRGLWEGGEGV